MDRDERHVDTSCESPKGATHTKLNVCVRKNAAVCMCLETAVCCTRDWCSVHKENHLGSCLFDPLKPGPQRAHQDHTGPRPPSAPLGKHEQRQRRRKKSCLRASLGFQSLEARTSGLLGVEGLGSRLHPCLQGRDHQGKQF